MADQPPFDFNPVKRALDAWAAQNAATIRKLISSVVTPHIEALTLQLPRLVPHLTVAADFARIWRETWERVQPDNWKALTTEEVSAAFGVMEGTGLCLVWTPREEIVRQLIAEPPPDAFAVVESRRQDILDDLERCLADVDHAEIAEERIAAEEAVQADRAGFHRAAQALCASVLTSVIHGALGEKETGAAHKEFADQHPREAGISQMRLRAIFIVGEMALRGYDPVKDRPPHGRFNRHTTVHRITGKQFTRRNSLSALMLVVPLLRELNFWLYLPDEQGGTS